MNIVFFVLMTLFAVYAVFNLKEFAEFWIDTILIVPKKIWNLIKKLFGK